MLESLRNLVLVSIVTFSTIISLAAILEWRLDQISPPVSTWKGN